MNINNIIQILNQFLKENIDKDYVLLDLPYYTNVGDVLIWEATLNILKSVQYQCVYSASIETYRESEISENNIIVFMGGGNFGDLWKWHQEFRHKVMSRFPNNTIIQLPQSVYFSDSNYFEKDIAFFNSHKGVVKICLRDQKSYNIIKENYKNVIPFLLPDMALAFDVSKFMNKYHIKNFEGKGNLFVCRQDCEKNEDEFIYKKIPNDVISGDWPTMEKEHKSHKLLRVLLAVFYRLHLSDTFTKKIVDCYYKWILKDAYIKSGINFLSKYGNIYSSRLHAAILASLMGKNVYIIDNSYNKIGGVYNLWLKDLKNVEIL